MAAPSQGSCKNDIMILRGDLGANMLKEMKDLDTKLENKIAELQKHRQKQLLQAFYVYFAMSIVIMILITFIRTNPSIAERLIQLLVAMTMIGLFTLGIYLVYRHTKNFFTFDLSVLILTLIYSSFALFFSTENPAMSNAIYMPVFLFLVFSTMNPKLLSVFLGFHISVTLYSFLTRPNYLFTMNPVNYVTIIMASLTVFIIAYRLIKLYNNYIVNLSKDWVDLYEKNIELNALNEEYYATQEELYDKYDEVQRLNQANESLAFQDALTELPNRNGFIRALEKVVGNELRQGYIVFVDIHRFKDINSVYSYLVGDKVLIEVADRLKSLRLSNPIVARLSGDLFAIIIDQAMDPTDLLGHLNTIQGDIITDQFSIAISVRFGILPLSMGPTSQKELLQAVDASLNRAKEQRQETHYFFNHQLIEEIEKRVTLTHALEKAIHMGDISTVFQPVVDSKTQQVVAYETLARWFDEKLGRVTPDVFISLAENTGLIIQLGELVLKQACQFAKALKRDNRHQRVTVNLSGIQLLQEKTIERLLSILHLEEIDPDSIGFEVTETDLIQDFDVANMQLKRLKDEGFMIYLDDFGTGFSSLNYLSKLPIDVLKIDRSFITDIHINAENQPLLDTILQLARTTKLITLAEGVETYEEYTYLADHGIHMIQGYYFSKPLKMDQILDH